MDRRVCYCAAALVLAVAVQLAQARRADAQIAVLKCRIATGDEAIAACTRALEHPKINGFAYKFRGRAYNDKGDYDRAIADFDQTLKMFPWPDAYAGRGTAYFHKGDYDRAIADFDKAIGLDPVTPVDAYAGRGDAYLHKHDYARAITDFDHVIGLDPTSATAYAKRGEAYEANNDPDRAIADFNAALRRGPSLAEAQRGLARVQALLAKRSNPGAQSGTAAAAAAAPPAAGVGAAPGAAERRIALVIGMSAYANVPALRNPVGDARAVAAAFRRLGFVEVIEREDLTRTRLEEVLKEFGDKASDADWAVIYYAGHGVEMNGENYLVPVDAELGRADHVDDEGVTLKRVLSKTEPAHRIRMVILDACRNNPFRMAAADGRPRAIGRGLSAVEPSRGVLVAFAARGGTVADDGGGEHSPFTRALLANLETPGVDIRIMFSKVRDQVLAATADSQEPFTYGSLPGEELYFRAAAAGR